MRRFSVGKARLRRRSPLKWALERLAFRAVPQLAAATLAVDAAGIRSDIIPHLFSSNLHRIDPTLNDDLLELYGRSEHVLANRFSFLNTAEAFEEEIGWETGRNPDWRAELHAFDYALDLALTYRISGETRYARHLRFLIADWIASNPPRRGTGWLLHPLARRIRNWVLAADLARADWERDPVFFGIVEESLALQSTCLSRHAGAALTTPSCLETLRALQFAGRFFSGTRGARLRSQAHGALLDKLQTRVRPDGGYCDSQPDTQLRLAVAVMEHLLFSRGEDIPSMRLFEERLRLVLEFLEVMILPEGSMPLFGSMSHSPGDTLEDLFALSAVRFREPRWKRLAGRFGILPYMLLGEEGKLAFQQLPDCEVNRRHSMRPVSGLYRLGEDSTSALLINAHPPSSLQDHQDFLTYHLSIRGQQVIVDSGAFTPGARDATEYFPSPQAHSVLLVDGRGPRVLPPSLAASFPEDWESGTGYTGLRIHNPGFAFLDLEHERAWSHLDVGAWVVLDSLEGRGTHRAVSLLHFYPTFDLEVREDRVVARSRSLAVTVFPLGRPPDRIQATKGEDAEFPGWYAPDYGVKFPTAVLALEWRDLESPWVGGYLIVPGQGIECSSGEMGKALKTLPFELLGKQHSLRLEQ